MKLAFSTLGCPDWELGQILTAAHTYGFSGIELRHYAGSLDLLAELDRFAGGPATFRKTMETEGVELACLDTSFRLTDPDFPFKQADRMIELAIALGTPYLRVFGGHCPEGEDLDACLSRAADTLHRLGERAHYCDLRVLLETHDAFCSGKLVARLLKEAGELGTGAIWDLNHPFRTGESPSTTAQYIASNTYHVHVKDSKATGELTLLGEGDIPLSELVSTLHENGYNGYLCLEWEKAWHPELPDAIIAFPQAAAYLTRLLSNLKIALG